MAEPKIPFQNAQEAKDLGVQTLKGLATGIRMFTDAFGAQNPVSKKIQSVEESLAGLLSAQAQNDSKKIEEILKEAQTKGTLENIQAGINAFATAPQALAANTLGAAIPHLAAGVGGRILGLGRAGILAVQGVVGATQGAGGAKGQIYSAVDTELRTVKPPLNPDHIEKAAKEAQSYNGKNLDQILLSAGLGGAAATTGAEKILTRILTRQGVEAAPNLLQTILKGGFSEAGIEGLQGGQQKIAENKALQREGKNIPTFQGVVAEGTLSATTGLVFGAAAGGVEVASASNPNSNSNSNSNPNPNPPSSSLEFDDLETARFSGTLGQVDPQSLKESLLSPAPWETPFVHHLAKEGQMGELPPHTLTQDHIQARDENNKTLGIVCAETHQTEHIAPLLKTQNLLETNENGFSLAQFCLIQKTFDKIPPSEVTSEVLSQKNNNKDSVVHTAFETKQPHFLPEGLLTEPLLTQKNAQGNTPIHLGAEAGSLNLSNPKFLNERTLPIQNDKGQNPLHLAIENGNFHKFPWRSLEPKLLETVFNQKDNKGQSPLELLQRHQRENNIPKSLMASLEKFQAPAHSNPINPTPPMPTQPTQPTQPTPSDLTSTPSLNPPKPAREAPKRRTQTTPDYAPSH